ncbi:MAG: metallophosphoesterase [Puniceicoccales bacterium]
MGDEQGRLIAIGDVHGCADELEEMLDKIAPGVDDTLIFLGDIVNRGPATSRVLQRVKTLGNARCLLGNHELRLLRYRHEGDPTVLKDYDWETLKQIGRDDWAFLESCELTISYPELETVFVHGGFLPATAWSEQGAEIVTSIQVINPDNPSEYGKRSKMTNGVSWAEAWKGPPFVICGHTPRPDIFRRPWSLCIDTGCVYGGKLTAYDVKAEKFLQVPARKAYI